MGNNCFEKLFLFTTIYSKCLKEDNCIKIHKTIYKYYSANLYVLGSVVYHWNN